MRFACYFFWCVESIPSFPQAHIKTVSAKGEHSWLNNG